MRSSSTSTAAALAFTLTLLPSAYSQYTATYNPTSLPDKSEGDGQTGTNNCGTKASADSSCQNVYVNSVDDFCLWGPPSLTSQYGDSSIGNVEEIVVSYCLNDGYGTRLIPEGTVQSAHFVRVVNDKVSYVQVTGVGDFTKMNIPAGDDGGELDPHSWTGLGNPQGGLVFSNAFSGTFEQTHEWTSFIGANYYCIRACRDGPNAAGYCEHIYDTLSCGFTIPGDTGPGFTQCEGEPTENAPGVVDGTTFTQGAASTPAGPVPGATYACTTLSTIGGGSVAGVYGTQQVNAASPSASMSASASGSSSASLTSSASAMVTSNSSASASASASASTSASVSASSTSSSLSGSTSSLASSTASASGPSRSSSLPTSSAASSISISAGNAGAAASQSGSGAFRAASPGGSVMGGMVLGVVAVLGGVVLL